MRSVLGSLFAEEPQRVVISNRTIERAERLAALFPEYANLETRSFDRLAGEGFDLIINGTSASLSGQLPPLPDTIMSENGCCYDMAYGDEDTVFVRWAREHGALNTPTP